MSASLAIIGKGVLADLVVEQFRSIRQINRWSHMGEIDHICADFALLLHDSWVPSEHLKAEESFRANGIPWLRGFVSFGEAVVGPLVLPDHPGCSQCSDMRQLMAGPDRSQMFFIKETKIAHPGISHDPWASNLGLVQTAILIREEVENFLSGKRVRTFNKIFLLNLNTFKTSSHLFLPDPSCPVCGDLPIDTMGEARILLKPCQKESLDSYRTRSIKEFRNFLTGDYLDSRTGLLNSKRPDLISPFADTIVNLPLLSGNEITAGRAHSFETSELSGILEGLERYCGYFPRGKQTVIYERYRNLGDQALNPYSVGVHSNEQYSHHGFPFKPFDPEKQTKWVWGHSFLENRPILVPENLAYYSLGGGEGYVYETSNGCALGGSLEEAILYGIFEIVERDSFLMTWYGRLPIPRLDPFSADDPELLLMIQRLRAAAGFEVYLFNSTTENGIPSIWAIAKNTKQKGLNLLCAAGAHLDPVKAAKGAVQELAGMLLALDDQLATNREKYLQMYHHSELVFHMGDHSMLYGLPEAEERLSFLLDRQEPLQSFEQGFRPLRKRADLTEDLTEVLKIFQQLNMNVIVVDQTSPELKRNSLYCVKVIIPGMLPMTFGYHLTRLMGLERVLNVPAQLGYTKEPLNFNQLNKYPHPFP